MDIKKLAAEKKAKALAELREAEAMEQDAAQIERMAAKHGWHIDIKPGSAEAAPAAADVEKAAAKTHTYEVRTGIEPPPKKSPPGKVADPNSTTSRSKAESINVIRQLGRPVPLSELNERIKISRRHHRRQESHSGTECEPWTMPGTDCDETRLVAQRREITAQGEITGNWSRRTIYRDELVGGHKARRINPSCTRTVCTDAGGRHHKGVRVGFAARLSN